MGASLGFERGNDTKLLLNITKTESSRVMPSRSWLGQHIEKGILSR